jgi:DNA-3-methyladenine glycosylase II
VNAQVRSSAADRSHTQRARVPPSTPLLSDRVDLAGASVSYGSTINQFEIPVVAPFRLDLTVAVLRRLSTNIVDTLTADGQYVRVVSGFPKPLVARIKQERPTTLFVTLEGCNNSRDDSRALDLVSRTLGVNRDLSHFYAACESLAWLRPLAHRMRGVKPPRYPTLWEACVNAVVFQQVSLVAASAILRRMITAVSVPVMHHAATLNEFPSAETFQAADDGVLRAAGLSANKLATLRRMADALLSGALDEASLQQRSSHDALAVLRQFKGIGPWTATLILLRGLARLDVFPMNDTSVTSNLVFVGGSPPPDLEQALSILGPQRGLLYYHLLLARLEARGEIGRASRG